MAVLVCGIALGLFIALMSTKPLYQEAFLVICIGYTLLHDEFLMNYVGTVVLACCSFILTSHLMVISAAVFMKPKPHARGKDILELVDADFDMINEIPITPFYEVTSAWECAYNVYKFCKFRPVYGLYLAVGVISFFLRFSVLYFVKDIQSDLYHASLHFILPFILLNALPIILANIGLYIPDHQERTHTYSPFEATVEVPSKILVGRTLAAFVNAGFWNNIMTSALLLAALFTSCWLVHLSHMSAADVKDLQEMYELRVVFWTDVRLLFVTLLALTDMVVLTLLGKNVWMAYKKAKRSTFAIIEKNWRRNMQAFKFLLPGVDTSSLEDLQVAFEKKKKEVLTAEEQRALVYIEWPLWQTKRAFVAKLQSLTTQSTGSTRTVAATESEPKNDEETKNTSEQEQKDAPESGKLTTKEVVKDPEETIPKQLIT